MSKEMSHNFHDHKKLALGQVQILAGACKIILQLVNLIHSLKLLLQNRVTSEQGYLQIC